MSINVIQIKRSDFLKKHGKTLSFSVRTQVEYPTAEGGVLHNSHNVRCVDVIDEIDDSDEELVETFFNENLASARKFQHVIDNNFKKSMWKYLTNSIYKRTFDDVENNHKRIINDLFSIVYARKEAQPFIEKRKNLMKEMVSVPDIPFSSSDLIYVVLLNQEFTLTDIDSEEVVMFKEYEVNNLNIRKETDSFVDYTIAFDANSLDNDDDPYSKINLGLEINKEEKTVKLRQPYSNVRWFIDKNEAMNYFNDVKSKITSKVQL